MQESCIYIPSYAGDTFNAAMQWDEPQDKLLINCLKFEKD